MQKCLERWPRPPFSMSFSRQRQASKMRAQDLLKKLIGKWQGNCRTWFETDKLADESKVVGEFIGLFDGRFVRHTYESTIQNKPRHGEELIAFNSITNIFQTSWVDDFHMNYAIMFSQGTSTEHGFNVRGEYDVGKDHRNGAGEPSTSSPTTTS